MGVGINFCKYIFGELLSYLFKATIILKPMPLLCVFVFLSDCYLSNKHFVKMPNLLFYQKLQKQFFF